jgi:hypothetical protein
MHAVFDHLELSRLHHIEAVAALSVPLQHLARHRTSLSETVQQRREIQTTCKSEGKSWKLSAVELKMTEDD